MKSSPLLPGKFAAERLPEICAPRYELLNKFRQEANKGVIFVSAPPGYGKSISTLLWLTGCGRVPMWMRLDDYDNSPYIFYKLFCTGIAALQPDNKAMTNILKQPAFAASPVEHAIAMLLEFAPDNKQYALVIDDMHFITNPEIRKSGLLVQRRLPASFITLILSRNEIAPEYIDLVGRDQVAIIGQNDLAFAPREIQNYFTAYGHSITIQEAESVHAITNGCAIGINALAMSGQITLSKSSCQIFGDYIRTHVWSKWDSSLREFMLKTSIVDTITPGLANILTGRGNSRKILDELCARNYFISHIGGEKYRYHHLFLEFLCSRRENEATIDTNVLYKKAAEYFSQSGDSFPARRFAILSGDAEAINTSYSIMNTGKSVSIDEYVNFYRSLTDDHLSSAICQNHPYIYSTYAWYYFLVGNVTKMEHNMDMLYVKLPSIIKTYPQVAQLVMLTSVLDHRISISEKIDSLTAYMNIPSLKGDMMGISIAMQMPYAHRSMMDFHELVDQNLMMRLAAYFTPLLKVQGNLLLDLMRSGILYEQNQLSAALESARRAQSSINSNSRDEVVFCVFIHLGSIFAAMKNESMMADALRQLEEYIEKRGAHFFRPNFMAYKAKIGLMDGDKTVAKSWLDNYFVTETEHLELYKTFQHFTTARAYIALSQTDKAMSYILKLKQLGTDFNRPLDIAEALILQAALEWATGNRKEALCTLETALTSMQGYGFVRIFANEGASLLPLLKLLNARQKKGNYRSKLNNQFLHQVTIAAYEHSKRWRGVTANIRAGKPIKLSKQQKRIISLLAKGYKNADIAYATGVTIHTVKSHCAAAYKKLEVNNAMDAVLKAKELKLIE